MADAPEQPSNKLQEQATAKVSDPMQRGDEDVCWMAHRRCRHTSQRASTTACAWSAGGTIRLQDVVIPAITAVHES